MDDLSAKLKKLFKPKPKGVFKGKANVLGGPVTVRQLIIMCIVLQGPIQELCECLSGFAGY